MKCVTLAAAIALIPNCGRRPPERLTAGAQLQVELQVTERASLTPELRESLRATSDSLQVPLSVDSARGDSIFGNWYANLRALGTYGDPEQRPRPFPFAGTQRADSVIIVLNHTWTDQDVALQGRWDGGVLHGTWETAFSPRLSGTFIARIARQSNDR